MIETYVVVSSLLGKEVSKLGELGLIETRFIKLMANGKRRNFGYLFAGKNEYIFFVDDDYC